MKFKKVLNDNIYDSNSLDIGSQLYDNAPVFYHWSNCAQGTQFIQQLAKSNETLLETIQRVWDKLSELKEIPIWLKGQDHIISLTMYDVYATAMGHIKKHDQEDNLFNAHEISFIGPGGPFKQTTLIQIINKDLYQDFVYFYLLKNKLPLRSFRLFVEGSVVVQFGKIQQYSSILKVKQLTDVGVLFSSKDDDFIQNIDLGGQLKFIIVSDNIAGIQKGNLISTNEQKKDLFFTTDSMQYFLIDVDKITKSLSYDSGITGEFFLFCRYVDMKESDFPKVAKEFLEFSKSKVFKESA